VTRTFSRWLQLKLVPISRDVAHFGDSELTFFMATQGPLEIIARKRETWQVQETSPSYNPIRKMAYLVNHYPAVPHTSIFNEIKQLRAQGFDISTVSINACDRPPERLPECEREERNRTFYVKPAGLPEALRSIIQTAIGQPSWLWRGLRFTIGLGGESKRFCYFVEALMIGAWMKKRGLRHLHVHSGMAAASVAMIVAKTFPVTYSLTIHGPEEFYDVAKFYLTEKVRAASLVCCIGSFARSQMMKNSPDNQWHKFRVVPLGVDPLKFTPSRRRPASAAVSAAPFEILCIGRLVAAKGQHILIAAVKSLIDEGRSVRLRLVGGGPERPGLERTIAAEGLGDCVILEGEINQDEVPGFLRRADVFALASLAEGIPVALMEAMAMEIPCVSTMIAGIPELIRSEIDGLLVFPSDIGGLADALRRLIDEPDTRRRIGKAGRLRVIDRYNLENNVRALGEVYRCLLP
jgi:colanic acid/amylovoran biosynthesis glycosyltransferase